MNKEAMKLALEALEYHQEQTRPIAKTKKTIAFLRAEIAKQECNCKQGQQCHICDPITIAKQEQGEPVAWVDLLKDAEQIVKEKFLYKRFIDGTPLANDIPCWMADFAQQYTTPQQRTWVGLTDEEINKLRYKKDWTAPWTDTTFARAIEAKLKEKNT